MWTFGKILTALPEPFNRLLFSNGKPGPPTSLLQSRGSRGWRTREGGRWGAEKKVLEELAELVLASLGGLIPIEWESPWEELKE
ncbi:hypothetical protein BC937DRAFT_87551 [Endogone sp. FLAS-F59071]|nr:hypothetical protein BC937DRAFT_87551 [Endogone sp. FLAS-F59071]|eukprot:RUS12546.1 hypothetical protein BC937DRAFT_87551 [Endogone sp. FLAS-F59071]